MMTAIIRYGVLVGVLAFISGCDGAGPSPSPLPTASPVQPTAPQPPPGVPTLSGPATTYHFSDAILYPVQPYTITSRYVLHDNGAFELVYPSSPAGGGTYTGTYAREGDRISFRFVSVSQDAGATGTLRGDLLEVRYTINMHMSDFEDAVYRRAQ
jgi:hypothetical protein